MEKGRYPLIDSARQGQPMYLIPSARAFFFFFLMSRSSYRNSGELFIVEAKPHFEPLTIPKAFRFYFEGKNLDRKDLNGKSGRILSSPPIRLYLPSLNFFLFSRFALLLLHLLLYPASSDDSTRPLFHHPR